jgi:hypothetical protein
MKKKLQEKGVSVGMKDLPLFDDNLHHVNLANHEPSAQNVICFESKTRGLSARSSSKKQILESILDHASRLDW